MTVKASELPSVAALSFLGDAVHSLFIRRMLVAGGTSKSGSLNEAARTFVSAEAQAKQAKAVLPHFCEEEAHVYRRAFNSGHLNRPKHASGADYRAATGFEAVLGMHAHLGNESRIEELMKIAIEAEGLDGQEIDK
ncbi:MAG: Mini-ribonuclease 3 [Clostridia bacterium]|nr:Mini-ribonuclease 3 [Clostridia bacterium]